jgi:hypothetical protein
MKNQKNFTITNIKKIIGLILITAIIFSFRSKNHPQVIDEKIGIEEAIIP